jgi:2-C-methyl-D-erythritol 2,4-cyclodiphosphate synthase
MTMIRIGQGFDAHCLVEGRKLVIGGVCIPYNMGLAGHSDADVLIHAIMDALLGAAGLGDIGVHFPPSDDSIKDISSLALLAEVDSLLSGNGWKVINIDSTIIAQSPRMSSYIGKMRENISGYIQGSPQVNIKATTTEKMGFPGRGEGIAAQAVALLSRNEEELNV